MTKCFILDTNVLLNDSHAPYKFGAHHITIPMAVLEELDNIKMRKTDLAYEARSAIRVINDIIGDGDATNGVEFGDGATMRVTMDIPQEVCEKFNINLAQDSNDNKIIVCALAVDASAKIEPIPFDKPCLLFKSVGMRYDEAILVSNDINMRLKAKGAGMSHAQEYRNDVVVEDTNELPEGYVVVSDEWLESIPTDDITRKSCGNTTIKSEWMPKDNLTINDWLIPEDDSWAAVITGFDNEVGDVYLNFKNTKSMMNRTCAGIHPKSLPQAIAVNALMDQDIDVLVVDGAAGSGKTLLALAASTEMIKGKKSGYRHENILYTRANVTDQEEVGFLPGDEMQKMAPWLGAAFDNMKVIARESKNDGYAPENSIMDEAKSFIELKAMMFFRGRSVSYSVLILDEAQNVTSKQIKTMISRAGENCKVIIMGNNAQIDNKHLTSRSSGLTYAMNKLHGQEFAQVVKLEGVVRSRLAAFAESDM